MGLAPGLGKSSYYFSIHSIIFELRIEFIKTNFFLPNHQPIQKMYTQQSSIYHYPSRVGKSRSCLESNQRAKSDMSSRQSWVKSLVSWHSRCAVDSNTFMVKFVQNSPLLCLFTHSKATCLEPEMRPTSPLFFLNLSLSYRWMSNNF